MTERLTWASFATSCWDPAHLGALKRALIYSTMEDHTSALWLCLQKEEVVGV